MTLTRRTYSTIAFAAAAALVLLGAPELLAAQSSQSGSSGRARVLVATFQPGQDVDDDFGKKIANKLRDRVEDFDLLTPVKKDEVENALDQFNLNQTRMDLIQWRQLASRLNAQLIVYGEIERSADDYGIQALFVESSRGDTTQVPGFSLPGKGGSEAEQAADRISKSLSDHVEFLRARLNCQDYLSSKQFEDAVRNCDRALGIRPNNAQALYLRGQVAVEQENWQEAIDHLSKAVDQSPSHENALQALAFAHAQADNTDEAINYYRQYLEFNPGATDVRLSVAYSLASAGAFQPAMQILQDGIERDSAQSQLWKYLGDVAIRQGTAAGEAQMGGSATITDTAAIRTAVNAYEKYAQLKPDSVTASLYRNMIGAHLQIGENEAAVEKSRQALEQISDSPQLWSIRADVLAERDRLDEAISAVDSVVALDSMYKGAFFKRGVYKLRNGDTDAALEDFRTAVDHGTDPNTIATQLFATGHSDYFKQGRYVPAARMFQTALEFAEQQKLQQRLHFWAGYSHYKEGEQIDARNKESEECQPARSALRHFEEVLPHLNQAGSVQQQSQAQLKKAVDVFLYRQEQIIKKSCS